MYKITLCARTHAREELTVREQRGKPLFSEVRPSVGWREVTSSQGSRPHRGEPSSTSQSAPEDPQAGLPQFSTVRLTSCTHPTHMCTHTCAHMHTHTLVGDSPLSLHVSMDSTQQFPGQHLRENGQQRTKGGGWCHHSGRGPWQL